MAKKTGELSDFFEYGIDIGSRTIYLGDASYNDDSEGNGVDYLVADKFIKALHILDSKAPAGDKPITVIQNTLGGSWFDGMAMFGAIKACNNHVTFKMLGPCMSMGSIIPQAADHRLIDPNATFMMHYGSEGFDGHMKNYEVWGDEAKRCAHKMESIYLDKILKKDKEHLDISDYKYMEDVFSGILTRHNELKYPRSNSNITVKFTKGSNREEDIRKALQRMMTFDCFLLPEEVVQLGLADEIIDYGEV